MKTFRKKWIFIAQFHFQDPDPQSECGSETLITMVKFYLGSWIGLRRLLQRIKA